MRVYAARHDGRVFVMILNREVGRGEEVRILLPGGIELAVRLPTRSYTSLVIDGEQIAVPGIGGG